MELTHLTPFTALSTAADLWVVSDIQKSRWTQEIDYYINFQITRAQNRTRQAMDPQLQKIMTKESVEGSIDAVAGPLMIVPHSNNLPAKCILYLNATDDWFEKANDVWNNLKRPSVKLFLPASFAHKSIRGDWASECPVYFIEEYP